MSRRSDSLTSQPCPNAVMKRLFKGMCWSLPLLFLYSGLAGPAKAGDADFRPVTPGHRDIDQFRRLKREVIVTFGGASAGTVGNESLTEKAISDSEEAERAITRAGGRVRFQYRTALIGFSAVLPSGDPFGSFLLPFKSGVPRIIWNWQITPRTREKRDYAALSSLPAAAVPGGLDRIGQRLLKLNGRYNPTYVDHRVHVYVMDSGILGSHPEFDGNVLEGYDGFRVPPTKRCARHGSLVAGIIGSKSYGVAPGVAMHSIRVADCDEQLDLARVIKGVDWVTEHYIKTPGRFSAVVNMSFVFERFLPKPGWSESLAVFERAVLNSISAGVTYVAAAGNYNRSACDFSPAWLDGVITVGSINPSNDYKAWDSNVGNCVDLFAPGVNITSVGTEDGHPWDSDSGTSFAAPHVSGVAAIVLWRNPGLAADRVWSEILTAATTKISQGDWCGVLGREDAPNILLHWGTGSDDGRKDAEPVPDILVRCP